MSTKIIETSDFGAIEVQVDEWHGFDWRVKLDSPRLPELFAAAKLLASQKPVYAITYPYRFMESEIKLKGEKVMALPTVDQVVAKYIETRAKIKQLEDELAEKLRDMKEYQDRREQWLLGELNKIGAKNVKTPHGTVYQTVKESVTMGDWDSFFGYVQETQQFNLLTHAVSKTAVLEIMGEERQNALPPGVNYAAIRTVNVRKS